MFSVLKRTNIRPMNTQEKFFHIDFSLTVQRKGNVDDVIITTTTEEKKKTKKKKKKEKEKQVNRTVHLSSSKQFCFSFPIKRMDVNQVISVVMKNSSFSFVRRFDQIYQERCS